MRALGQVSPKRPGNHVLLPKRVALAPMPTATVERASRTSRSSLPPAESVEQLDPRRTPLVDVERERTGEVGRHDCYDADR